MRLQFKNRKQRRAEARKAGKEVGLAVTKVYFTELARSNDFDKAATKADEFVKGKIKQAPDYKKEIVDGALKALRKIQKKVREAETARKEKRLKDLDAEIDAGRRCMLCGLYFEDAHGYPAACPSCWESADDETKNRVPVATIGLKGGAA